MLKACPFCGYKNLKMTKPRGRFQMVCVDCQSKGPTAPTEEAANRLWNTRPPAYYVPTKRA